MSPYNFLRPSFARVWTPKIEQEEGWMKEGVGYSKLARFLFGLELSHPRFFLLFLRRFVVAPWTMGGGLCIPPKKERKPLAAGALTFVNETHTQACETSIHRVLVHQAFQPPSNAIPYLISFTSVAGLADSHILPPKHLRGNRDS